MILDYARKVNGMYILKKSDFDDIATMVLNEYMPNVLQSSQAVDIEYLAQDCLFMTIRNKHITYNGVILGMTAFGDVSVNCLNNMLEPSREELSEGSMLLDNSLLGRDQFARRRFTLSHESSHWILHRSYHSPDNKQFQFRRQNFVACRSSNIECAKYNCRTDDDWEEWQADKLAAALLMPYTPFKIYSEYVLCSLREMFLIEGNYTWNYREAINKISAKFKVSKMATKIRLKEIGLLRYPQQSGYKVY